MVNKMGDHTIDVNTASVEDLEKLKGIGRSRAETIISRREALGSFQNIEEILQVPGIGRSFLELNRDTLRCTAPPALHTPQTNPLRRSQRRIRGPQVEPVEHLGMINSSDKIQSTSCGRNKSSVRVDGSPHGRGVQKLSSSSSLDEDTEEEEEKDELLDLGLLNCDDQEDESSQDDELKDVLYVIRGHKSDSVSEYDRDIFRSHKEIGAGLGSDTPHEEAVSDTPFDVPLSPMRLTDEIDIENEEDDIESRITQDEDMVTDDSDNQQCLDKKQNKRKSELCTDSRGSCPVKKTCKAIDTIGCERVKPVNQLCHKFSPPPGLKAWLSKYQSMTQSQKFIALDSLIDICDLSQVRHIHQTILPQFQRDFISLLPKELALYVLSFLEPSDLLRAAQTCKYWNVLAADNLLWREKCKEAGLDDHINVLNHRRKKGTSVSHSSPYKAAFMREHRIEMNWRTNPLRPPRILKGHDDHVITCLQFSGNTVVSGSDDNTLKVWDATSGKCMRTLTGHTGGVWSSQMADNLIVSGSTDRMLRVWNATTGECIHILYGHTSTVRCLHLHEKKVVSGSRDATLRVWDISSGLCEHVLVGHVAAVRCVQYNGKLVVSGAYDYMVKVWNPDSEECLHTLQGHTNRVYSLQFDGVHVVSGSLDTSIRVWDVESGQCKHTLMGHQSLTSGMELKHNILISGNADSTVKVWDIITGQCLQTLSGAHKHRSAVTCLQFNNKFVVTSSDDGTVKLWDVKTGEFIRNLVALDSGGSGGVVWRIRASDTKLVCAVGSRNGTEETKLLVLDFDVAETNSHK